MTDFCANAIEKPPRSAYSRGVQLQSGKKSGTIFPDMIMEARSVRHRFTLIELLTVIGIASVVMALAIPAFTRMIAGNKVDEMAGRLKLGLEQAQSIAATENRYVALLLPNGSDTDVTDTEARRNRLGGFRPAFVNRNDDTYTFDRWVDGHDWKNAPEQNVDAAALVKVTNSTTGLPKKSGDVSTESDAEVSSGEIGISGCASATTTAFGDLKALTSNPIGANTGTVAVVFGPRGGIMNAHDLYFVVAAAKINGTDVVYPAKDSLGPVDYRILMLHQYTGRVEFK